MRKTKNVFLDSSAIIGQNLDLSSPSIDRLAGLALIDEVNLLTTTIVIREVEAKFRERIRNAEQEFSKLGAKHTVLKIALDKEIRAFRKPIDSAKAERDFSDQYRNFREDTSTTTIPLESASLTDVFDSYFASRPPFGDGKKKAEFPDAVNVSALEKWCKERCEKVYVIAADGDLADYCNKSAQLIWLSKPSEYIDAYSRESVTLQRIEASVQKHTDELRQEISTAFSNAGVYLEDQDGDVNEVVVNEVAIEDMSLLKVEDNVAKFEISAELKFTADISFDDRDTAIWDSVDKRSIALHRIETEIQRSLNVAAVAEITLDTNGNYREIQSVTFTEHDFGIIAREDDY